MELTIITNDIKSMCIPYNITKVNRFKKMIYDNKETVYSGRMVLEPGEALFELNFKMSPNLEGKVSRHQTRCLLRFSL